MSTNVRVCKIFTFDSAHQLIGHKGKCANVHGHTYKLEVVIYGPIQGPGNPTEEGFVIDFGDLKKIVKEHIVDPMDHAFLSAGNEPSVPVLSSTGSKLMNLGFRTTVENIALFICQKLKSVGLPVYSVKLWETPTAWAEVLAEEIPPDGPTYNSAGGCDCE